MTSFLSSLLLPSQIYYTRGLFTLMPFSTLPNFGKVAKKVATFSLLSNFDNYIRNSCQNFGNYAKILATFGHQSEQALGCVAFSPSSLYFETKSTLDQFGRKYKFSNACNRS